MTARPNLKAPPCPDLTNGLLGVIMCLRQEPIAMVADVEGMFHQVRVAPDDCNALRFLWWPNDDLSKEPVDHQMLVHLLLATSSRSCASFCLKKTASDNQGEFDEETITTVHRNFYVDDCLSLSLRLTKRHVCLASYGNCCQEEGFGLPNGLVMTGT